MPDFALGMNAKLFQDTAQSPASGLDPATMTELSNVTNVSLSLDAGEANTTTRGNGGWKSTTPTLKEATLEFEMQWKSGDANLAAIRNAYLNNTTIALAALTGVPDAASGNEGPVGNWSVTNFSRAEELEESIKHSVTCKLNEFGKWFEAPAS